MNNDYGLAEKHLKSLNLMIALDEICQKNGLCYSLYGGALLGAARNGEIIPWDDDIDIAMPRAQFEKLKLILSEYYADKYQIVPSELAPWLTNILFVNEDGSSTSMDVFILDYITNSHLGQNVKVLLLRTIQGMLKEDIDYTGYTGKQKILLRLTHIMGLPFSRKTKIRMYDGVSKHCFFGKKELIHRSNDSFAGLDHIFPASHLTDYTRLELEGCKFMVVKDYKAVLEKSYGKNYMTPPPEKDRIVQHNHNKSFLPEENRGSSYLIKK